MGEVARKPDLREQVGVSVNASSLQSRSYETPLDRVAAVGAAALDLQLGATANGAPIGAVRDNIVSPVERIAAELITELWHIRYGGQFNLVPQAVTHFSCWMFYRGRFAAWTRKPGPRCCRSSRLVRCTSGSPIAARRVAALARKSARAMGASFARAAACSATPRSSSAVPARARRAGRHATSSALAASALTREEYDAGRWGAAINAAIAWLTKLLANRLNRPLTVQLERRKKYD
jgi:hypothetical protein